ncbi:hypothetical protein [Arenibacter sp. ARW7G5Y1]|uniref:hypothetical protein n=1 Tax=Arenibacter sp. ARW7G5Y1 TaxID=2135619 RepID=UPI0015E89F2C|nr:hypothetical protein [Arenibacter sp. ARW7G5Y1]
MKERNPGYKSYWKYLEKMGVIPVFPKTSWFMGRRTMNGSGYPFFPAYATGRYIIIPH